MDVPTISLDTAAALLGVSRRTLWRRIAEFERGEDDIRGRAMVRMSDVLAQPACVFVDKDDHDMILRADAGEADAQNDLAMLLSSAGRPAAYWFELAAGQGHADAMHHLARHHVSSNVPIAVMWLAKAASLGHVIAAAQLQAIVKTKGS